MNIQIPKRLCCVLSEQASAFSMIETSIDGVDYDGLRQRNQPQWTDPTKASDLVAKLNEEEKIKGKNRKTFGRTDNGTGKSSPC